MNEGTTGLLVLVTVSILSAAILHWSIKRYLLASFISAVSSSVIFQIIGFIMIGHYDPLILIAFVTGACAALGIAAIVGIPFFITRRRTQ